jgi:predicted ATP-grasp superfamily ATP-dependent carboligase
MPSNSPAHSPEGPIVLIAAVSGRALAAAARRAGLRPRVVDFFSDLDTRALTDGHAVPVAGDDGFSGTELLAALGELAGDEAPLGVIYGAGFEDRPQLLAALMQRWTLFGNRPDVVRRAKDPEEIARACAALAIPHPQIAHRLPEDADQWLINRQGGGGGGHIVAAGARKLEAGEYYQRRVAGSPVSVLLIADGRQAQVLGLSTQWTSPGAASAYRFGGAVQPPFPKPLCAGNLREAAIAVAQAFALSGLNSIDFLVDGKAFHLLEVNPRPGATLDIFEDAEGRLLRAHIEACRGVLPQQPLVFARARASTIAYAPEEIVSMPEFDWPDWCRDRQNPGTHVARDAPICSIVVDADEPAAARRGLATRLAQLLDDVTSKANKLVVS